MNDLLENIMAWFGAVVAALLFGNYSVGILQ